MIRILYCIDALDHGGTEKQLVELIRRLDRTRFEPLLCTLRDSPLDPGGLDCPHLRLRFRSFGSPSIFGCVRSLRRFLRDRRVDVVQAFFQDATILGALAGRPPGRLRVGSLRDLGFWRSRVKDLELRWAYPRYDGFVANSRAVADSYHRAFGLPLERIEVIHNGVAEPPAGAKAPEVERLRADGPVVGLVANLNRAVKRPDLFVEAAARIRARRPDARFVIVGDGRLRPALAARAEALGLTGALHFAGRVDDVHGWLRGLDVGVLCSDSEGFPNAVLEYMSHGVPVVATSAGGTAELLEPGDAGRLVEPGDALDLARAVLELLDDPALRKRLGAAGERRARSQFSVERYVGRYESYYESVAAAGAGPAGP